MGRRRGFFAEMQHQARLSEQRQRAADRQHEQAIRRATSAQRAAERAQIAAQRASEQDRKRLEREAAQAYTAARVAEAEDMTSDLQVRLSEIDGLLAATLEVDDFVDLESLRAVAHHPPFHRPNLETPTRLPAPIPDPPLPVRQQPEPVKGLFGKKQKQEQALAAVEQQYANDYWAWSKLTNELPARRAAAQAKYEEAERTRQAELATAIEQYNNGIAERDREVKEQNEALDQLIAGLGYGTVDAVQEYIAIVLANSVYPEWLTVAHRADFDPIEAELKMRVIIPGPDVVPTAKHFKYVKATDEISSVAATQKDTKDRYAGLVNNVALRSLHEVFEADRRALIKTISLELGTETTSPATGQQIYVPFLAGAASREEFEKLDLSAVVPAATLEHLGAVVSKNPYGLVPIEASGVRRAR
jgi:restriction system protein